MSANDVMPPADACEEVFGERARLDVGVAHVRLEEAIRAYLDRPESLHTAEEMGEQIIHLVRCTDRLRLETSRLLAVFAGLAFFMLPTEIHENYLFPTIPLLTLATVHERGAWRAWAILSVTWFFNLVFVDVDLMDAVGSAWPGFGALVFPIQVGACVLNIGVLVVWLKRVLKGRKAT